jgi:hypothetical protein
MTFFRSSSAAVFSEKNLEQNILLLKDIAAVPLQIWTATPADYPDYRVERTMVAGFHEVSRAIGPPGQVKNYR